jgi:hypothetical protein
MSPDRRPAQLATFAKALASLAEIMAYSEETAEAVFSRLTIYLERLQLLHETLARKMLS